MKMRATVFAFNIWHLNADGTIDYDFMQTRFVLANTEEEAESKLDAHRMELVKNGFADFRYVCKGIAVDNVIV